MLRKTIIVFNFILFGFQLFGQNIAPSGGYRSFEEYKTKSPGFNTNFSVQRRTVLDIKAWGGNDYRIKSMDEQISKSIVKKEIWGIQQGDTLYLNALPLTGLSDYAKVEVFGRYSVLHIAYPVNPKFYKAYGLNDPYNTSAFMFGAIGGAAAGAAVAIMRVPVIYDLQTGDCKLLNADNLSKVIQQYPSLEAQFTKEKSSSNEAMLIKYIVEINKLQE